MPELPEVERGRMIAAGVVEGRRIEAVQCAADPIVYDKVSARRFAEALRGRRVESVCRRGKQLWFELDRAPHPLFHFGMSGAFHAPGTEPLELKSGPRGEGGTWPPRYWKIRLVTEDGGELAMTDARRLGRILLRESPREQPPISRLGFDPLLDPPGAARFSEQLRSRGGNLKSLLLDQGFAAGVGNWIADEVLYQARIDPRRRASDLSDAEARRVHRVLLRVVRRAVAASADDAAYPRTWLFHRRWGRREDATTARGEPIEHITVGGRTTAWVPAVQC